MNNQFSQRISDIIAYSKEEANRLCNNVVTPEHLLLGMLRDGEGNAIEVLLKLNVDLQEIKAQIEEAVKQNTLNFVTGDNSDIALSPASARILKMCMLESRLLQAQIVDAEHLLLAILKDDDNHAARILQDNNASYNSVYKMLTSKVSNPVTKNELRFTEDDEDDDEMKNFQSSSSSKQSNNAQTATRKAANDTPVLDNFGTDVTKLALDGKLDPVIGREKEIERVAQILSRRKKNNPILIGEPGVGKSAIVEGLATRIVQKKVSRILFNKRVVLLDMASVDPGTNYRRQFEERIRSIINELQRNPDIILFIDEIHTIVGAGSSSGSMDAANMLKPALARGEIQ